MNNLEYYLKLNNTLIRKDYDRDQDFINYDKMWHIEWEKPGTMPTNTKKSISTDPHDSVAAATKALSVLDPEITFMPLSPSEEDRERANQIEKILKWTLWCANRRRQAPIHRDLVHSALLYHEICAQVIDIDWQIKESETIGINTNWLKAARKYGRFMVNTYNPRYVHTKYSNVMQEGVLLAQIKNADEIIREFGDRAKQLKALAEDPEKLHPMALFDYSDYDTRVVYCWEYNNTDITQIPDKKDIYVLQEPEEQKLPFSPWVCRVGGSTLEYDEKYKRHPQLFSVLKSDQWNILNIVLTLSNSKAITLHGKSDLAITTPTPDRITVDYEKPENPLYLPPGSNVQNLTPGQIDPKIFDLRNELRQAISRSTSAGILQSAELPSGTAYATYNLMTQIAIGNLKPYQALAENVLEEILIKFLEWTVYRNVPLEAYGIGKNDMGEYYSIQPDEIDPRDVQITVALKPDTPTDRTQKINAASIAVQTLDMSKAKALEEIGITDPEQEIRRREFEKLKENDLNIVMQQKMSEMQLELQQMQMQLQAQAQQAQANAQLQATQQAANPMGIPGNVGGEGFNPAMGGQVPATAMPEATRENQTGMTRTGQEQVTL